jgi:hypothetical protein
MGIFDDADSVLEVMGTARLEFEKNQVFRTAHPHRDVQEVQGSSSSERRFFVGVCRKHEVKWNARVGGMTQAKHSIFGHRIPFNPRRVGLKPASDEGVGQLRSG